MGISVRVSTVSSGGLVTVLTGAQTNAHPRAQLSSDLSLSLLLDQAIEFGLDDASKAGDMFGETGRREASLKRIIAMNK